MMEYLSTDHFPAVNDEEKQSRARALDDILSSDFKGDMFALLGSYQRILADNCQRGQWKQVHEKLQTLFMAGWAAPLDGPMVGSTVSIRDSDYFKDTVEQFGQDRSAVANIEWMATAWNLTFSDTGLWMGKTFETVSRDLVAYKTKDDPDALAAYDASTTRVGRNYFRQPPNPNLIQGLGLPALTEMWRLRERPTLAEPEIFDARLTPENAEREKNVPYSMTGGLFLADMGTSVVPEMKGKAVYQLNYRWPRLEPAYPMTRLVDEIVQIGEGIYLGQLVFATRNYAYMSLEKDGDVRQLGKDYEPHRAPNFYERIFSWGAEQEETDYGYQNNGFFLMMDPAYAERIYADAAFPQLRPRPGESGYTELGYDQPGQAGQPAVAAAQQGQEGWKSDVALKAKFTTLILESSPKTGDREQVTELLQEGESVLQMLQRISNEVSAQTRDEDRLEHFEKLNRLFRCGVAPTIKDGLFQRNKAGAFNTRIDGEEQRDWYGAEEPLVGLDYYHGANLNLHCGLGDNFRPDPQAAADDKCLFPSVLAAHIASADGSGPNVLNEIWHSIGKYIFPWAGKSFERVSARKLSMLLDESDDLAWRYPPRVNELKSHPASAPHYKALLKDQEGFWREEAKYASHLKNGSWDSGMMAEQKEFWEQQSSEQWVFGNNLQDSRILAADPLMHIADMNYGPLDPAVQAAANAGPSPFVRQGYVFLGAAGQESILPMNNGSEQKKGVFQFHYRYPMIGGPAPIGYCLDELVEIADGLFLGQLIYATKLNLPFHSSLNPSEYKYQLFGYFLLLDDDWQRHRLAIQLDTID